MKSFPRILSTLLLISVVLSVHSQDKKPLELTDIMKFRQVRSPSISNDGNWVVHTAQPDRGDPEVLVYSADGKKKFTISRGEKPVISYGGKWVAAVHTVPAEELLKAKPAKGDGPKAGLVLLNTSTGEQTVYDRVKSFSFSNDGKWLLYQNFAEEEPEEKNKKKETPEPANTGKDDITPAGNGGIYGPDGNGTDEAYSDRKKNTGTLLNLLSLEDGVAYSFPFVTGFAVDSISTQLAFVVADSNGAGNGVFLAGLMDPDAGPRTLYADSNAWADNLNWNNRNGRLAFLAGILDEKDKRGEAALYLWIPGDASAGPALADPDLQEEDDPSGPWKLYHKNSLRWSTDGERLFLGIKPDSEIVKPEEEEKDSVSRLFDTEAILADRTVDVWHWKDPFINPNQKKRWERVRDRTYTGVYYPAGDRYVKLADPEMPELRVSDGPLLLGASWVPYAIEFTWDEMKMDYYLVDPATGERKKVLEAQKHSPNLSPDGKYLVYFRNGHWHLLETSTLSTRNLTAGLPVPFADEDWDYPGDVPGYRVGDWLDGSTAVLIYDKFDLWKFPTRNGEPVCLTRGKGRSGKYMFRLHRFDRDRECLETGEPVLLTAYNDAKKFTAVYSMKAGLPGIKRLAEEPKKYSLLAKATDTDRILFTRESYTEFPDLWITGMDFKKPRKLSDVNPQVGEFAWGEAGLVEWKTGKGVPLQGILIKPGNYKAGQRYPVLVYYYRFFTDRLYEFNEVVINHRPCYPYYASHGYAVFLPDIRFEVGRPGYSATECLVPGVQKIIDMGVADPDAICLHGHSWSGYQTAFVITRTDIFACAIAGAPVANMTSAYSGIRWGSGLARQFQYEQSQSRIGASLWEARDLYIENSPVFYADRIHTPLLIEFGDQDDAVPWYQGIELYLAMRRLGKDCVFLQYDGEPHHLKQYANKLDYTIKFKQYLDHYLKGEPAADWIKSGVPYRGK